MEETNMTKRTTTIVPSALLLLIVGLGLASAGEERNYRGEAYNLQTGEFLYSENHQELYENGQHVASVVSYRDAMGREIVRSESVLRSSRTTPDFRSEDQRTGYTEGAQAVANGTRLFWREDKARSERGRTLRIPAPGVIDAGFDYFIRENWDELAAGKALIFHFAVPHQLDYYHFRVGKSGEVTLDGIRCIQFRLAPAALLARLFVDPIYVAYDVDHRRLMDYRGVTNIPDDKGKNHRAWITFTYPWTKPVNSTSSATAR